MNPSILSSSTFVKKNIYAITSILKRVPWVLAYNAFLTILICVLLELLVGELLFYKYAAFVDIKDPLSLQAPVVFKEATYQSVVKEWGARENLLSNRQEDLLSPFK